MPQGKKVSSLKKDANKEDSKKPLDGKNKETSTLELGGLCSNGHTCQVMYELPSDYPSVECDGCDKNVDI
jgi:hypothetical protein